MAVACQCSSCRATYQVPDEYRGHKVKCPKCGLPFDVPRAVVQSPPAAAPLPPPPKPPAPLAKAVRIVDEPPRVEAPPPLSEPPIIEQPPIVEESPPPEPPADEEIYVTGLDETALRQHNSSIGRRKRSRGMPVWLMATVAVGGMCLIAGIAVGVYLASRATPASMPSAPGTTDVSAGKRTVAAENVPLGSNLLIDWPEAERTNGAIFRDAEKIELPAKGEIRVPLPPRKEQYTIRLVREGFQPIEFRRTSRAGEEQLPAPRPEWQPLFAGFDWPQNYAEAQRTAAQHGQYVLVLFDHSDGEDRCRRFATEVALRPEFRQRAARQFVCVYIDLPKSQEAIDRVEDVERNRKLAEKFEIAVFPTVLVVDAKSRVLGIYEGYSSGGITPFLDVFDAWESEGKQLESLLGEIDSMPNSQPRNEAIYKALDILEVNRLERFYLPAIEKWQEVLPLDAERPVTPEIAQTWLARFAQAEHDPDDALRTAGAFDKWKTSRKFADHNMAADLYCAAGMMLARTMHYEEAAVKYKEALALNPADEELRAYLTQMIEALAHPETGKPRGVVSGAGFCIAPGGYVLTTHHIIAGATKVLVRLDRQEEPLPAKVIANDAAADIALVEVELPPGTRLAPLALVENDVAPGEKVCALGHSLIESGKAKENLAQGVVRSITDDKRDEGRIVTDCRLTPGTSGGPLCTAAGAVAGMVTEAGRGGAAADSAGLAIPATRLRKFLRMNLPGGSPPAANPSAAKPLPWKEVNSQVSPSVVEIQNAR